MFSFVPLKSTQYCDQKEWTGMFFSGSDCRKYSTGFTQAFIILTSLVVLSVPFIQHKPLWSGHLRQVFTRRQTCQHCSHVSYQPVGLSFVLFLSETVLH